MVCQIRDQTHDLSLTKYVKNKICAFHLLNMLKNKFQTEDDILLRTELEEIEADQPNRFKVWYTLDRPDEGMCVDQLLSYSGSPLIRPFPL